VSIQKERYNSISHCSSVIKLRILDYGRRKNEEERDTIPFVRAGQTLPKNQTVGIHPIVPLPAVEEASKNSLAEELR
jgi:hypothetical protein